MDRVKRDDASGPPGVRLQPPHPIGKSRGGGLPMRRSDLSRFIEVS